MKALGAILAALTVLAGTAATLATPTPVWAQGREGTGLGPAQVRALRVELSVALSAARNARGEAGTASRQAAASRADLVRVGQLLRLATDASPEDVVQAAARWVEQDVDNRQKLADLTEIVARIETGEIRDRATRFVEEARIAFEDGRLQDADRALEQLAFLRQSASVEAGDLWIGSVTTRSAFARQRQDFDGAERIALEARREARRRARHDDFLLTSDLGLTAYQRGDEKGDNAALVRAIDYYSEAASLVDRSESPDDWAATQHSLGNALRKLGERESGTARLEEAVDALRAALEERTRERVPLEWAETQNSLGNALGTLGDRESGTARLEEASVAFRAALEERTRERVPLEWAETQSSLGSALGILGERESGTARLEEAVVAYRASLEERTRERVPLEWATATASLAVVRSALFDRTGDVAHLDAALTDVRGALEAYEAAGAGDRVETFRALLEQLEAKHAALP